MSTYCEAIVANVNKTDFSCGHADLGGDFSAVQYFSNLFVSVF